MFLSYFTLHVYVLKPLRFKGCDFRHSGTLSKPKSVALVIYLAVVNNYTVIQHVKQILDDFVVSAVSSQNCARKCVKSQVLFLPTASQSFFRP